MHRASYHERNSMRALNHYIDRNGQPIITDLTYLYTIKQETPLHPPCFVYAKPDQSIIQLELCYVEVSGVML